MDTEIDLASLLPGLPGMDGVLEPVSVGPSRDVVVRVTRPGTTAEQGRLLMEAERLLWVRHGLLVNLYLEQQRDRNQGRRGA